MGIFINQNCRSNSKQRISHKFWKNPFFHFINWMERQNAMRQRIDICLSVWHSTIVWYDAVTSTFHQSFFIYINSRVPFVLKNTPEILLAMPISYGMALKLSSLFNSLNVGMEWSGVKWNEMKWNKYLNCYTISISC